jgi:hypothetical protein
MSELSRSGWRSAGRWECVFDGRAGGYARAVFASREQARQFAERHAKSIVPSGMPRKWEDTAEESTVLVTQLGHYLIAPMWHE